jgi:hypothetical protein
MEELTCMVIPVDVATVGIAHGELEVITQVITSPFTSELLV